MSGFVRKFGKAKTFSNLVVRFQEIFFSTASLQTHPTVSTLIDVRYKQAGTMCAWFAQLLY